MTRWMLRNRGLVLVLATGAVLPQFTNCLNDRQLQQILTSVISSAFSTFINSLISSSFPTAMLGL